MEIKIKNIHEFYPTIVDWSKEHGFQVPTKEFYPYDIFVLNENGIDTYCVGVFVADQAALTVFAHSNKKVERSKIGLELLYKTIEKYVKQLGVLILLTTTDTDRIRTALDNCGWIKGDVKVDHYFKVVT